MNRMTMAVIALISTRNKSVHIRRKSNEFFRVPTSKRRKDEIPRDATDRVFCEVDGVMRIFKKGESFMPKLTLGAPQKIYTIVDFVNDTKCKKARCKVYISLAATFLRVEEANRIKNAPKDDKDDLKGSQYAYFGKTTQDTALRDLGQLCEEPQTHIYFDPPLDGRKPCSADFHIAYYCVNNGEGMCDLVNNARPAVLDLFAGVGGFSTGLEATERFDVPFAVEIVPKAACTLKVNHRSLKQVYVEDVNLFLDKFEAHAPGYPVVSQIDHVHASSPCQGFSKVCFHLH
jgi:C-5 cytosine-specific DNA methylase